MLQSLYMISDLPKWGLLRFTVGDYNDGLCHIAAIRRGKLGLGADGVRIGQWIRPDFSQSSNAPSEAPLLTTYNQRTGSLSQSPSSWGWRAGSLCLDRDRLCERLKLKNFLSNRSRPSRFLTIAKIHMFWSTIINCGQVLIQFSLSLHYVTSSLVSLWRVIF